MPGKQEGAGRSPREVNSLVDAAAQRVSRRRAGVVVAGGRVGAVQVAGAGTDGRGAVPHARTLFEIGSITKTFTALPLAVGVVRGHWGLDTPVRELLPEGAELPDSGGGSITLQHLATHTSGLPRSPKRLGLRENVAYLRRGADPYARLTEAEVLADLGGTELGRAPGTGRHRYSNLGFGLLGTAMSTATGVNFGNLVRTWICDPLELTDTVTADQMTADQNERMARGHRSRRRPADPWPLPGMAGAGALRSTAADMTRFLEAQVAPPVTDFGEAIRLTQRTPSGGPRDMGLGWHRAGGDLLWHNGGTGGFRSIAVVSQEAATLACVLVNQSRGADLTAFRLLRDLGD